MSQSHILPSTFAIALDVASAHADAYAPLNDDASAQPAFLTSPLLAVQCAYASLYVLAMARASSSTAIMGLVSRRSAHVSSSSICTAAACLLTAVALESAPAKAVQVMLASPVPS